MVRLQVRRGDALSPLFNHLVNDYFVRNGASSASDGSDTTRPRIDVVEAADKFVVKADLPGVTKEEIEVTIEGNRVSIAAQSKLAKEVVEGEKLIHVERRASRYARSFELPAEVTEQGAVANFENGVLQLTLPKRASALTKRLTIN